MSVARARVGGQRQAHCVGDGGVHCQLGLLGAEPELLPTHAHATLDSCPHRTYDPDFLEFGPSGKQVRQGVVRKVQYAFASAPLDFVCEADETPVVEAAVRTLYNCKQTLSPYIRYPCPGKGGCTLDYNTTWWVVGPAVHMGAGTLYEPAECCFMWGSLTWCCALLAAIIHAAACSAASHCVAGGCSPSQLSWCLSAGRPWTASIRC
jgi:hypothetical protein